VFDGADVDVDVDGRVGGFDDRTERGDGEASVRPGPTDARGGNSGDGR
jgi:hypothetical protein